MVQITLTPEQAQQLCQARGDVVELRDAQGHLLAKFNLELTPEWIAELKRRAREPGPWYSGTQIQARLRALQEEWDRTGGFDETYMREFLKRLDEADPGHVRG